MKSKGFTLIELIVSMAIIGIIAVSILPIFSASLKNIIISGNRMEAISLANDNIYDNSQLTSFKLNVKLPDIDGDEDEWIEVEGNKITGSAQIKGYKNNKVEFFIYRPNSY